MRDSWRLVMTIVVTSSLLVITSSADAIHCYCNSDACADTGPKCRSQFGRCFSKMRYDPQPGDVDDSVHGCIESLTHDERTSCLSSGDVITRKTNAAEATLAVLMCCTADMCNYIDQVDPPHVAIDVFTANHSQQESSQTPKVHTGGQSHEYHSAQDVWFRAAVIAVPIAGGVILVILVLLALRMLRYDSRRQYEIKRNQSLVKAQLYVADHFSNFYPAPSHVHVDKTCLHVEKATDEPGAPYQTHSQTRALYETHSQTDSAMCLPNCQQCNCDTQARAMSYPSLIQTNRNSQSVTISPSSQSAYEPLEKSLCATDENYTCYCDKLTSHDHSESCDLGCLSRDQVFLSCDHSCDHRSDQTSSAEDEDLEDINQSTHDEQVTDTLLPTHDIV